MKIITFNIVALLLLLSACGHNKKDSIIMWKKLTIVNDKDTVIYQPSDAVSPSITVNKVDNLVAIQYGIEETVYDILGINTEADTTIYELRIRLNYHVGRSVNSMIIKEYRIDSCLALWWYLKDEPPFLFTNKADKYKILKEETYRNVRR